MRSKKNAIVDQPGTFCLEIPPARFQAKTRVQSLLSPLSRETMLA